MTKPGPMDTAVSPTSYECTIAVECCVFGFQDNVLKILLVKRSIEPFKDHWVVPGGVMREGKTLSQSVNDVLENLTGIKKMSLEQVACYSAVDRHPVKRVVSISFYALVKPENYPTIPKNYISDIKWYELDELPKLGFDHDILVSDALNKLKENLKEHLVFGELLPDRFTLTELQDLYESILGENLDRRNFRKKILQMNLLEDTKEKKVGVKGGPSLYKLKK
ncbi:NUDIX domain-containing protein [Ekhidna sp.]|uniref:NUDIX hydrolase n=1 Tax=Ekhidna sp. TaxID=2608089 RepID=UPI0035182633